MPDSDTNVTVMLSAIKRGDSKAAEQLLPVVYEELRKLATFLMGREKPGQTLQPTALVHEAYVKMLGGEEGAPAWDDRRHFFNAAAMAMRRILVDRHRRVNRERHGGGRVRQDVDAVEIPAAQDFPPENVEALEIALNELKGHNERWGEIVHLRYFTGLTIEQTAELLNISPATVKSDWMFARAWLHQRVKAIAATSTA